MYVFFFFFFLRVPDTPSAIDIYWREARVGFVSHKTIHIVLFWGFFFFFTNNFNFSGRKENSVFLPFFYQENGLYFTIVKNKLDRNKSKLFRQYHFKNNMPPENIF